MNENETNVLFHSVFTFFIRSLSFALILFLLFSTGHPSNLGPGVEFEVVSTKHLFINPNSYTRAIAEVSSLKNLEEIAVEVSSINNPGPQISWYVNYCARERIKSENRIEVVIVNSSNWLEEIRKGSVIARATTI
jgi:hypothetical protein